ncbi:hypothetical protein L3X38_001560 [Prunus dulcis]|uniref:Uncharacterized protein n=1 Tax=Prunus dulcis TaxID=3755 RepID=A0AAD4WSS4_PRUDU|nr:hypothetical protein L3X38_001560 [Prunus dulcis]
MAINRDSTPPPMIGKIGPYTVFMTPPSTPKPPEPVFDSPKKVAPPPVQPPPQQLVQPMAVSDSAANGSVLGVFKNAVNKVQKAHSSLDDHLAPRDWRRARNQKRYLAKCRVCNVLTGQN